jgi:hypothetical protein
MEKKYNEDTANGHYGIVAEYGDLVGYVPNLVPPPPVQLSMDLPIKIEDKKTDG